RSSSWREAQAVLRSPPASRPSRQNTSSSSSRTPLTTMSSGACSSVPMWTPSSTGSRGSSTTSRAMGSRRTLSRFSKASRKQARPTVEVVSALRSGDLVIIGPSNPLISIAPVLQLVGDLLRRERTVAVTPIIGGLALKGPTVEMMRALGHRPDAVEVARMYKDVAATFVLDERDSNLSGAIEELGYRTIVCDTVMRDGGRELADSVLRLSHV